MATSPFTIKQVYQTCTIDQQVSRDIIHKTLWSPPLLQVRPTANNRKEKETEVTLNQMVEGDVDDIAVVRAIAVVEVEAEVSPQQPPQVVQLA